MCDKETLSHFYDKFIGGFSYREEMNEKACIFLKSKLQDEYINILFKRKR